MVLQARGNTETIATHLREVHYWLAIACDICKAFASTSLQIILEQHSECKVKLHKKKSQEEDQKMPPKVSSSGTDKSCWAERHTRPSIQFYQ